MLQLLLIAVCVVLMAAPLQAQSVYTIVAKNLEKVSPTGTTAILQIAPGDTPGFQRFRLVTVADDAPWTMTIETPERTKFELNQENVGAHIVYGDVIAIPVWTAGLMSFTGSASAPKLLRVSAVVRQPSVENRFPMGDFDLEPYSRWPAAYKEKLQPALAVLWSAGKAVDRLCNATQIAPGLLLTALHCVIDVVDQQCRLTGSGTLRIMAGPNPFDAYGAPLVEAIKSAVPATPVFCGVSGQPGKYPWPLDYAIVATMAPINGGAMLMPIPAAPGSGSELLLAAYLSDPASGKNGGKMVTYEPGLFLSRDKDCQVPPLAGPCPAGQIVHQCDTWESMSGGAVMTRADNRLVGVHYLGSNEANCAVPWQHIVDHMKSSATTAHQKAVLGRFQ